MRPKLVIPVALLAATGVVSAAGAQSSVQPAGQKSLAATLSVYVFPAQGQTSEQQSKDETQCYGWAVENVGVDPFDLAKKSEQAAQQTEQAKQQVQQAGQGAGVKGAVGGAAMGALIGEIASDDAGKGATYGAAAGMIAARRGARRAKQQATAQIEQQGQQVQQATGEQITNFKKAFSVCLEAKDYMVKY